MTKLIYLVGLPGSGKSTFAKGYIERGYKVFSSDMIRAELYGDESVQDNPQKVFNLLHKRIKDALRAGENCIYDATNVKSKTRVAFLNEIKNISCEKICVVVWAPIEVCKERNAARDRSVPDYVIERMWKNFETPYYFEGWDKIFKADSFNSEIRFYWKDYLNKMVGFNQENSHHSLTLYEHCCDAYYNFLGSKLDQELEMACLFHDYGKVFTKTFYNKKGELDKEAHYYNHQNAGAYEALGLMLGYSFDVIRMSALICYHMHPYFWENNPKMEEKYKRLWGEDFYNDILLLHEADLAAH